jgi:hypothetical protein
LLSLLETELEAWVGFKAASKKLVYTATLTACQSTKPPKGTSAGTKAALKVSPPCGSSSTNSASSGVEPSPESAAGLAQGTNTLSGTSLKGIKSLSSKLVIAGNSGIKVFSLVCCRLFCSSKLPISGVGTSNGLSDCANRGSDPPCNSHPWH